MVDYNEFITLFNKHYGGHVAGLTQRMHECDHALNQTTDGLNPYHLEGSVWNHTCMVLAHAHKTNKSDLVKVMCVLHDIGKTETRKVHYSKRWGKDVVSFQNHASVGAYMAYDVLADLKSKGLNVSYKDIVCIFKCIAMHHDLYDLATQEKNKKEHLTQFFSKFVGIQEFNSFRDLVECDAHGRITMGDMNNDFMEIATEENYHRYNQRVKHQDTATVTFLIAPPRFGKTTYINAQHAQDKLMVVSRDDVLMEYVAETLKKVGNHEDFTYDTAWRFVTERDEQKNVDRLYQQRLQEAVKLAKTDPTAEIYIDKTNMSKKSRQRVMGAFPKDTNFKAVVLLCSDEILERNIYRGEKDGKTIDYSIIEKFKSQFVTPSYADFESIIWWLKDNDGDFWV